MKNFTTKVSVVFGDNATDKIIDLNYNRILVVTDGFMVKSKMSERLTDLLKKKDCIYTVYSDVVPNVPIDSVVAGVKMFKTFCPDMIIALGGGSSIDTAKAIIYFSLKSGSVRPYFVSIPTTSGTGSEATAFAVIKDGDRKVPIVDDEMIPDLAILDTYFVKTVPDFITADTGIDALTHGIEAYLSTNSSVCTDALAEKAIEIIFKNILIAYRDGKNDKARENLNNASYMAGVAFNNAKLGINHSMAHTLGAKFNISHGRANAIVLPRIVKYNSEHSIESAEKYCKLARILELPSETTQMGVKSFIIAIEYLLKSLGIESYISNFEIKIEDYAPHIPQMIYEANEDICTSTSPYKPSYKEWQKLFWNVF